MLRLATPLPPLGSLSIAPPSSARLGSLRAKALVGRSVSVSWIMLGTWWVPKNTCLPTECFPLVDVQPLGRIRVFVCFSFLWLYLDVWLVISFGCTQNSRIWGNWSFSLCSTCLSVWGIFYYPSSPGTVLYSSSLLLWAYATFSSPLLVIRTSEGETKYLIYVNIILCVRWAAVQVTFQGKVGTTFTW